MTMYQLILALLAFLASAFTEDVCMPGSGECLAERMGHSMLQVKGTTSKDTVLKPTKAIEDLCEVCVHGNCEDELAQCSDTGDCHDYHHCAGIAKRKCVEECGDSEDEAPSKRKRNHDKNAMLQVRGTTSKDAMLEEGPCEDCVHGNCEAELAECADGGECGEYHRCAEIAKEKCVEECGKFIKTKNRRHESAMIQMRKPAPEDATAKATQAATKDPPKHHARSKRQAEAEPAKHLEESKQDDHERTETSKQKRAGKGGSSKTADNAAMMQAIAAVTGPCEDCVHENCDVELAQCADDGECDDYHKCAEIAEDECQAVCGRSRPKRNMMIQMKQIMSNENLLKSKRAIRGICEECVHENCDVELDKCADDGECDEYHKCAEQAELECAEECGISQTATSMMQMGGPCEDCVHDACEAEKEKCADENDCSDYHQCKEVAMQQCAEVCGNFAPTSGNPSSCRRRYVCPS